MPNKLSKKPCHLPPNLTGLAFVKGRLNRLPQGDETWEADYQALPQPMAQNETHYLGMVVTKKGGSLLADLTVHGRPSVNDLATLLANAMRRPPDENARRPTPVAHCPQRLPVLQAGRDVSPMTNFGTRFKAPCPQA